jgi:hypothetical protein
MDFLTHFQATIAVDRGQRTGDGGHGDKETRRQGDRETGRQGDRETGRQGDRERRSRGAERWG